MIEAHKGTSASTATEGTVRDLPAPPTIRAKEVPQWRQPKLASPMIGSQGKGASPPGLGRGGGGGGSGGMGGVPVHGVDGKVLPADAVRRIKEASALRAYVAEMPK